MSLTPRDSFAEDLGRRRQVYEADVGKVTEKERAIPFFQRGTGDDGIVAPA